MEALGLLKAFLSGPRAFDLSGLEDAEPRGLGWGGQADVSAHLTQGVCRGRGLWVPTRTMYLYCTSKKPCAPNQHVHPIVKKT